MGVDGWEECRVGDVAKINAESLTTKTPDNLVIRYLDIASVPDTGKIGDFTELQFSDAPSRAKRIVKSGDVIVSTVRPYLRAFAQIKSAPDNLVASTGFAVLTPSDKVSSDFLYQYVLYENFSGYLISKMKGSNYPAVTAKDIANAPISVPRRYEQQKIAETLGSVDEAIAKTEAMIAQTQRVKQGLLQTLLTKGIGHTKFKQTELGEIPESWEVKSLEDISTIIRGASPRPKGDPRYYGGSVPRLMVSDVTRDKKYVTPIKDFLTEAGALKSRPMPAGSLFMVCSGTVGVPGILAVDACIHDGFLGFKDIHESCDKEFLFYVFTNLQQQLDQSATHGGVFTNLTTSIVKEFQVALPSLSEQREISATLSNMDKMLRKSTNHLDELKKLKKGLMADLLTGRVRVGTDQVQEEAA
jgi:type I restriction enzyme S subunit